MNLPDGKPAIQRDLFKGQGEVKIWDLLHGVAQFPFTASLFCQLEPKGVVGEHRQPQCPEIVICIGGLGRVAVNGKWRPFAVGDLAHLPVGHTLQLENPSDEPLNYLIIKTVPISVNSAQP